MLDKSGKLSKFLGVFVKTNHMSEDKPKRADEAKINFGNAVSVTC